MDTLAETAPAFVEMAHRIVWATVATVDDQGRPRSRVLHPLWQWDGTSLVGWIATGPTPTKVAHLSHSPYVSVGYWSPDQDTCTAECRATLIDEDDDTRVWLWDAFVNAPAPVGYDPAIIPPWSGGPTSPAFVALRLEPWWLRVQPGALMAGDSTAKILHWRELG
jgi:general stress protein 26